MVKLKNLVTRNTCQKKAYYLEGMLDTQKSYHYYLGVLLSSLVKETNFLTLSEVEVEQKFNESIPQSLFTNDIEYNEQKDVFLIRFANMQFHLKTNYEIVKQNVFGSVIINGQEVKVTNLLLLKHKVKGNLFLATFKSSKMKLTLRGKKEDTLPAYSIDLAAIQLLAQQLFKEQVTPMMITLKSRNGNSSDTSFEEKETQNIISYPFQATQLEHMKKVMSDLLALKISKESPKCITSDCDTCPFLAMCQPTVFVEPKKRKQLKKSLPKELNLTSAQEELIFSEKGVIRANAGAGAGKTTVVAARYLNMIASSDLKSSEILLITYTRKGAEEMRNRINEFAPGFGVTLRKNSLKIMTFHEFCQQFITANKSLFGYKKDVKLASIAENMDLANETISNVDGRVSFFRYNNPTLNMFNAKGCLLQLLEWIEYIRDMNARMEDYTYIQKEYNNDKEISLEDQKVLNDYYAYFEQVRKEKSLLQYDVLLAEMMDALQSGKVKASQLKYKHIMIDEAQDTDDYQLEIIVQLTSLLKENFKSLLLIGDDAQSIFGFRRTSTGNFIYLKGIFKEVKDIHLDENFRSTKAIVDLGNNINKLNKEKIDKLSVAVNKVDKYQPELKLFNNEEEEYALILNAIQQDIKNGVPLSEIAVIARKNVELKNIQNILSKNGVASIIITPEKIVKRTSTQAFVSLAKVLKTLPEERTAKEIFEAFSIFVPEADTPAQIELFVNQLNLRIENEFDNVDEEQRKVFITNYFDNLLKLDMTLEVLKTRTEHMTIDELLNYLIVIDKFDDDISYSIDESVYEGVVLTTIHTSKGKEFDHVYHTVSGYTSRATSEDEERNLLFVAVTRAKSKILLTGIRKKSNPYIYSTLNKLVLNKQLVMKDSSFY